MSDMTAPATLVIWCAIAASVPAQEGPAGQGIRG